MVEDILKDAERRMKQAIDAMVHDFSTYRTGRANPVVLERVHVEYYGVETPLNQMANITVPEPRQLMITPYDKSMLGTIEKAIQKSDLGINPSSDGICIRLNFPQMTEDRRKELVKQVNNRAEQACVAVRNVRRDANEHLKAAMKNKEIGEDDEKAFEAKIQKMTDKFVAEAHDLQKKKDAELMEI
ncbi:MAG TPA: ribosome recycling factor [Fimbriimonadaceae bacterium]|nr:ribosome recycling factor [Fimbriimonadaceae bacterium]HRJ96764.1 ribosome recycling factor [Fimbriimonadaceae bacterium]